MSRLHEYTLQCTAANWSDLLASWGWLLPADFTVWIVNRFGDLFLLFDDGSVHWLDVGVGELQRVADSRGHFAELIDDGDTANDWLMIPLSDDLVAAGVRPGEGECYSYVQLPVLGGDYSVENTRVVPLEEHFGGFGPIHERIKNLPDGTSVIFTRGGV